MDFLIKPIGHELARGSRAVNNWLFKQCPEVGAKPVSLAALVHDSVPDPDHPAHPRNPWVPASRHQRNRVRDQHEPAYDSTAVVQPTWQHGWMAQTPLAKYRMANGLAGDAPAGETREERNKRVFSETAQWFAWTEQHCDGSGWGMMDERGAQRREGQFGYQMAEMGGKVAKVQQDADFTNQEALETGAARHINTSPGGRKFKFNPAACEFTPSSGLSPTSVSRKSSPDEKKKRDEGVQAGGFTATAGHDAAKDKEIRYRAMPDRCLPRAQSSSSAAEQSKSGGGGGGVAKEQVGGVSSSSTTVVVAAIDDNNAATTDHNGEQESAPTSSPAVVDDDVIVIVSGEGSQSSSASSSSSWEMASVAASASVEEPVVVVGASIVTDNDIVVVIGEGDQASSDPSYSESCSSSSWETGSVTAPTSADDLPVVVVGASIVAVNVGFDVPAAASPPPETAWARREMPGAGQRCWSPIFGAEVRGFRPRSSLSGTGA